MAIIPLFFIIIFLFVVISGIIFACCFVKKHGRDVLQDDISKQLHNYQNLLENGFITEEEFEQKKRELLNFRRP